MLFSAALASATTYYVDPATGSDANAGTSASTVWKTPPGTRTVSNSGFLRPGWGSITTANKIKCGDTILLKGGSTQTNSQGGGWLIDGNYFTTNCTTGSRITFRLASNAEWSGSTGAFAIDGSGITPAGNAAVVDKNALVSVQNVNFVELKGISDSQRLIVRDSTEGGIYVYSGGSNTGFRGDWWDLLDSRSGFNIARYRNWQVSNALGHNVKNSPFQTNMNSTNLVEDGAFVDCLAHNSGCGSTADAACSSGGGDDDLFFFGGSHRQWCVRCTAHDGGERGVNTGPIGGESSMGGDFHFSFRDLVSYSNGKGPNKCVPQGGHACSAAGFDVSGNNGASADRSRNYVLGARIWDNPDMGLGSYQTASIEAWNVTSYGNDTSSNVQGEYANCFDGTTGAGSLYVANAINLKRSGRFGVSNCASGLTVQSSCLRSASADSESLGSGTYTSPGSWFTGANNGNLTKRATGAGFCGSGNVTSLPLVAFSMASWAANDWRLCTGANAPASPCSGVSVAIDAGRFYLLANGASSGNTITVKANGGTGDPRNYLIAQNTYLDPLATDTEFQIAGACGVRHAVSMTATTITFDGASCSWADNAGVHRPWLGSAPDMGAFESGLQAGGPSAPNLLSVQPIP